VASLSDRARGSHLAEDSAACVTRARSAARRAQEFVETSILS
jgi:hypothetical protein